MQTRLAMFTRKRSEAMSERPDDGLDIHVSNPLEGNALATVEAMVADPE